MRDAEAGRRRRLRARRRDRRGAGGAIDGRAGMCEHLVDPADAEHAVRQGGGDGQIALGHPQALAGDQVVGQGGLEGPLDLGGGARGRDRHAITRHARDGEAGSAQESLHGGDLSAAGREPRLPLARGQVVPVLRIAGRGNRPGERRRAGPIGEREVDVEADAAGRIDSGHAWRRRGRRGGAAGEPDATGRSRERARGLHGERDERAERSDPGHDCLPVPQKRTPFPCLGTSASSYRRPHAGGVGRHAPNGRDGPAASGSRVRTPPHPMLPHSRCQASASSTRSDWVTTSTGSTGRPGVCAARVKRPKTSCRRPSHGCCAARACCAQTTTSPTCCAPCATRSSAPVAPPPGAWQRRRRR